jgi:sirohydrochlorin cobaltochelatase
VTAAAVLLGHGSPDPAAAAELEELRILVGRRLGIEVALAVLEFPRPGLPQLAAALAALGGRGPVAAQPLVLFDGLHGQRDLPAAAAGAGDRLGVEVRLGSPLGREPALLELAAARLRAERPAPGDVLLFVGRGSSEPLARRQTGQVASAIADAVGLPQAVCYAGISRPTLAEGVAAALETGPRRVLALPYLLHTGVLARRVRDVLAPLARRHGTPLTVLPYIGNGPVLVDLVAGRLESLL